MIALLVLLALPGVVFSNHLTDVLCQGDHPLAAFNTRGRGLLAWRQSLLRGRTVQTVWLDLLLSECAELLFLNGHRFVLSLFPTRCTAFTTARRVIRLRRQQVLRPACNRGIRTWIHSSWAGAGQLGV